MALDCFEDKMWHHLLHEKPYFLFPNVLERWSFQKNCTGTWYFLYYQERWYFFFLKIWSYSLGRNVRWSFSKKYMEIWYFLQVFWKDHLSQNTALKYYLSCIIRKDGISFSWKYIFSRWKKKMVFLFPINLKLPFGQKSKDYFLLKLHLKNGISGTAKKSGAPPRKDDIDVLD